MSDFSIGYETALKIRTLEEKLAVNENAINYLLQQVKELQDARTNANTTEPPVRRQ